MMIEFHDYALSDFRDSTSGVKCFEWSRITVCCYQVREKKLRSVILSV